MISNNKQTYQMKADFRPLYSVEKGIIVRLKV
jgi:hypothetical protein